VLANNMFADTIDSTWPERARRSWTTLTSFGLQAIVTAVLLLLPLLRPTGMPSFHQLSTPISLGQRPIGEVAPTHASGDFAPRNPAQIIFMHPTALPSAQPAADDGPPALPGSGSYVPGTSTSGDPRGIASLFDGGTRPVQPVAPPPTVTRPLHVSHMSEGNLIRKVQPAYPQLARTARIQGSVVLQAVISKEGAIENLKVLTGHPMLVQSAIDAVRQWRYRPYILNGDPIEVETQIVVNFSLAGS
jgi:periplasmic protein TonB